MIGDPRLITRIALFSALVYVLSWTTSAFPNVNLLFFVLFSAGFLWGALPGILVGLIGVGLWTAFNPYGPATWPAACGVVGSFFIRTGWAWQGRVRRSAGLVIAATVCTCVYYLPVSAVDAWLFQPFWPRFITGMMWSLISLVSNVVIFPLLFGVVRHLYEREGSLSWRNRQQS